MVSGISSSSVGRSSLIEDEGLPSCRNWEMGQYLSDDFQRNAPRSVRKKSLGRETGRRLGEDLSTFLRGRERNLQLQLF